jgi:hypothetical protein
MTPTQQQRGQQPQVPHQRTCPLAGFKCQRRQTKRRDQCGEMARQVGSNRSRQRQLVSDTLLFILQARGQARFKAVQVVANGIQLGTPAIKVNMQQCVEGLRVNGQPVQIQFTCRRNNANRG